MLEEKLHIYINKTESDLHERASLPYDCTKLDNYFLIAFVTVRTRFLWRKIKKKSNKLFLNLIIRKSE